MNIVIAAIGKLKPGPERQLFDYYATRAGWKISCSECEIKGELNVAARKAKEAEPLQKAIADIAQVIALDEKGALFSSKELAAHLAKLRDGGCRTLGFLIGGAEGLDETLLARANPVLSFGRITWPHMLMRVLLAEQLYRAHTILSNHPYHRE